jgi:hypothetical protein
LNKGVLGDDQLGAFHGCGRGSNFALTQNSRGEIHFGLPPYCSPQEKMAKAGLDPRYCGQVGKMYGDGFYAAKKPSFSVQATYQTSANTDCMVSRIFIAICTTGEKMLDIQPVNMVGYPPEANSYRATLPRGNRDYTLYDKAVYVFPHKTSYVQVYFPYIIDVCDKGHVMRPAKVP